MLCSEDQFSKHLKLFLQPSLGLRAHQIAMLLLPTKKTIFKKNELLCWVDFVLKESCALSLVSKHKALAFLSMPASHRSECCLNVERTCNVSSVHVPLTFFKQSRSCGQLLGVGFESLRPLPTSGAFILELLVKFTRHCNVLILLLQIGLCDMLLQSIAIVTGPLLQNRLERRIESAEHVFWIVVCRGCLCLLPEHIHLLL